SLGIAADLERDLQKLVDSYSCEWKDAVNDPDKRALFRHFANDTRGDDTVRVVPERGQHRPAPSPRGAAPMRDVRRLPVVRRLWVRLASVHDVPRDGGIAVRYGGTQLALFRLESR